MSLLQILDWEEETEIGQKRYSNTFFAVADKLPDENVVCVSCGKRFVSINCTITGLV